MVIGMLERVKPHSEKAIPRLIEMLKKPSNSINEAWSKMMIITAILRIKPDSELLIAQLETMANAEKNPDLKEIAKKILKGINENTKRGSQ